MFLSDSTQVSAESSGRDAHASPSSDAPRHKCHQKQRQRTVAESPAHQYHVITIQPRPCGVARLEPTLGAHQPPVNAIASVEPQRKATCLGLRGFRVQGVDTMGVRASRGLPVLQRGGRARRLSYAWIFDERSLLST